MRKGVGIIALVFGALASSFYAQTPEPKIEKCKVCPKQTFKYKLISIGRSLSEPPITGLRIVVKQPRFNRTDMAELARVLKAMYCHEESISAVIFDDSKVAKQAHVVVDQLVGTRKVPELRGYFSFDKQTGKTQISFSTKRGNPPEEIALDL